jgi:hypothetical protein
MTIEIEAGASQSQFSMKSLVVYVFFGGQPCSGKLSTTDADWRSSGHSRGNQFAFQIEEKRKRGRDTIPKPSA